MTDPNDTLTAVPPPALGIRCGFDVVRALKAGYGARRAGMDKGFWLSIEGGELVGHSPTHGDSRRLGRLPVAQADILADDWTICGPNGEA